jgi:hypothetical protein
VDYDLSEHVREEIARRRIPSAVVSVLENPQQKVPEHGDMLCYQSKIDINQKEYLVRNGERNHDASQGCDCLQNE